MSGSGQQNTFFRDTVVCISPGRRGSSKLSVVVTAPETRVDFRPLPILVDSTRCKSVIRWQKRAAAWEFESRQGTVAVASPSNGSRGNTSVDQIPMGPPFFLKHAAMFPLG